MIQTSNVYSLWINTNAPRSANVTYWNTHKNSTVSSQLLNSTLALNKATHVIKSNRLTLLIQLQVYNYYSCHFLAQPVWFSGYIKLDCIAESKPLGFSAGFCSPNAVPVIKPIESKHWREHVATPTPQGLNQWHHDGWQCILFIYISAHPHLLKTRCYCFQNIIGDQLIIM